MAIFTDNPYTPAEVQKMGQNASAAVASATNINLEQADGEYVDVSGTTTIAGIYLLPGHRRVVRFTGALTLTHSSTLVCPGAADLVLGAESVVTFVGDDSSVVRVYGVQRNTNAAGLVVAATRTLLAGESGSTIFFGHATEFVMTLPAPALGLNFRFFCTAAPASASYTIVTASSANIIKGQVYTLDVNSATDPDFETSGGDTITFVDSKAVAGDSVDLWSDGTNWFARAFCSVFDAITITTAS